MQIVSSGGFFCASMLLSDNGIDNNDALPRQDAVQISHACCKTGVRATRPRFHRRWSHVGESPTLLLPINHAVQRAKKLVAFLAQHILQLILEILQIFRIRAVIRIITWN